MQIVSNGVIQKMFSYFMQIVSIGDNLYEMSNLFFGDSLHKISKPVFWQK